MQANCWVLTDRYNDIVVVFEDGRFNETQHVSPLNDTISENLSAGDIAQIMKEICPTHPGRGQLWSADTTK